MKPSSPRHMVPTGLFRLLGLCIWWLALASCGGGENVAGVGTGGTGLKEGSVSGFGSVFIDGVRYDDSEAVVQVDDGSGTLVPGQLKLGQRVRARINAAGALTAAEILPALVGTVDQAPDPRGFLMVMGQWVRFVSGALPYQSTLSSSTYLGGYGSLGDIARGDAVEVHGVWFGSDPDKGQVLVASRIEKLTQEPARMLISGTVSHASSLAQNFTLSAADGRQVVATGSATSVGDWVRVWVKSSEVPGWNVDAGLSANAWSTASLVAAQAPSGASVEISGLPEQFDPKTNRVKVQGLWVRLRPGTLDASTLAALQAGTFSRFLLRLDVPSGEWIADDITPREGTSLGGVTALIGQVTGSALLGGDAPINLRGVEVRMSDTLLQDSGCLVAGASHTTLVLTGTPEGSAVQALTLGCNVKGP